MLLKFGISISVHAFTHHDNKYIPQSIGYHQCTSAHRPSTRSNKRYFAPELSTGDHPRDEHDVVQIYKLYSHKK